MLNLNNVELVCIDTTPNYKRSIFAIEHSIKNINFGKITFITNLNNVVSMNVIRVDNIKNNYDYNYFIVHDLYKYITLDYILLIQWDGFVLNPNSWVDEFFNYDYIGARWLDGSCGNGGFSLRSKHLFDVIHKNIQEFDHNVYINSLNDIFNEDVQICICNRQMLEQKGIKFCISKLVDLFSIENNEYNNQFGFHGYIPDLPKYIKGEYK